MKKNKFTVIAIVLFVLSLIIFFASIYFVWVKGSPSHKKVKLTNVEVGEVSTQIGTTGRYYKGFIVLGVKGKKTPKKIQEEMPQIKDAILGILRSSDIKTVLSQDGMENIKKKMVKQINHIMDSEDIVDVYFTESIVQ